MRVIEHAIDVAVPVSTAYGQWTRFQEFPRFMAGVDRVDKVSETRTHWVTTIAEVTREFEAEIVEQWPNLRIAWASLDAQQVCVVTFRENGPRRTRVLLQMKYAPEGLACLAADGLSLVEHRIKADLWRFKEYMEMPGWYELSARG